MLLRKYLPLMVSKGRPARGRLYNLWSPQRRTEAKGSHAAQSRTQHSHRSAALNRGRWHRGIQHISEDLPSHPRRRRGIRTACRRQFALDPYEPLPRAFPAPRGYRAQGRSRVHQGPWTAKRPSDSSDHEARLHPKQIKSQRQSTNSCSQIPEYERSHGHA